jgi:hypothetical protein
VNFSKVFDYWLGSCPITRHDLRGFEVSWNLKSPGEIGCELAFPVTAGLSDLTLGIRVLGFGGRWLDEEDVPGEVIASRERAGSVGL